MTYAGGSGTSGGGWSFGKVLATLATITGLLAFLGYPTYRELLDGGASPTPSVSPIGEPGPEPTDRESVRWEYIEAADKVCGKYTGKAGKIPDIDHITVDWMKKFLTLRRQMIEAWVKVEWPVSQTDAVHSAQIRKIWADFNDATWSWAAMVEDLRRKDRAAFNRHLEFYSASRESFVNGANRFGFSVCNYGWATVSPYV